MENLENRLKNARKKAKLTQPKLADIIGVSLKTIKNYEKDAAKITVEKVKKIALACGVDEIWLLTGQGGMSRSVLDSSKTIGEHQDLVGKFKNPGRALSINQKLVDIEHADEVLFERVNGYISGAHETIQYMKEKKDKES